MTIPTRPLKSNGHLLSRDDKVGVVRLSDRDHLVVSGMTDNCAVCDIRPKLQFTADAVEVQEPCTYPNGITTEITLSVPSGRLLVTDDLRPVYDWDDNAHASYNSALGRAQVMEAMAAIGCAYGPVGNSCPGFYRTGPDTYIIARPSYDDDDSPSLPEDTCLARICTDLWAYSIADFEDWKARGGNPDTLRWSDTLVDVRAGTYRFTHHSGERGFNGDAADTVIFAHVERLT